MATYNSSFQDADYGCGSNSQISGQFTLTPTGISHSEDNPAIALVAFSYTNELTLQNVKYSTTTNQDVSAWLVYTTNAEPLGATDKTFVPRQDCTTTTNSLSGTVYVPIDSTDSLVKFGARWSGFSDNPEGLAMDSLEWFNYDLSSDYTISAPQNLQVTFPNTPEGDIAASIEAWSTNPNIDGTVQPNGNQWNWRVELISASGDVLTTREFNVNQLTTTLSADTSKVRPNTSYTLKVTVSNEYQQTTSVESPVIKSLPSMPIIRRVTFADGENGTYTATIDWAKPQSGKEFNEWVTLNVPGYVSNEQVAAVTNGASQVGSTQVTGLPPATAIKIVLSNTSSAGQQEVQQTVYTPSKVPTLTAAWDDIRRCVTITPTATNVTDFNMTLGYYQGDDSLGSTTSSSITACDLNHGGGQILYATATPQVGEHVYDESIGFATFLVPNPVLGVSKTCFESKHIVDIVESKDGVVTSRWQNGDRIVTVAPCPVGPPTNIVGYYDAQSAVCVDGKVIKAGSWFSCRLSDGLLARAPMNTWGGFCDTSTIPVPFTIVKNGNMIKLIVTADTLDSNNTTILGFKSTAIALENFHYSVMVWCMGYGPADGASWFDWYTNEHPVPLYRLENGEWKQADTPGSEGFTQPYVCS